MADLKKLAEELVALTVKEATELGQILKDEYGIEPAAAAVAVELGPQRRSRALTLCLLRPGARSCKW